MHRQLLLGEPNAVSLFSQLDGLIRHVARQQQVVAGLHHPRKPHEEHRVDAHDCVQKARYHRLSRSCMRAIGRPGMQGCCRTRKGENGCPGPCYRVHRLPQPALPLCLLSYVCHVNVVLAMH